ncbi:hypothetical protein QJQ45_003430 [Haematococcus lacustris]|nr:hypothetical protein QJQ45_003430 [Haematococcus lacustris]
MELLAKASVIEHMMRGPHHRGIRLLPGEVAVFEQPSRAWPVAMLKQLDEVHMTGDGNSLNANATTIITSIKRSSTGTRGGSSTSDSPSDFSAATHIAVGVDLGVTKAIKAGHAMRHPVTGQVVRQWEWELSMGQLKHDSGLTKAKQDTARWSNAIQPQLQQLAATTPAGTTLNSLQAHILALKSTWGALWEEYLKPRSRRQRLGLHHAQERVIERLCKKWVSRHQYHQERGVAVFLGAGNFSQGGWKAGAVREGFRKVVEQPSRPRTFGSPVRLVIVDEFRTTRVSSSVHARQPSQEPPPPAQDQPPTQAPPGPVPQPQAPPWGRWLDRDTNSYLNIQCIGERMQRPLELCSYEGLEALPPVGKEYHQGYKRVNDRLPKVKQRLHRVAEYRRGINGRARNNA